MTTSHPTRQSSLPEFHPIIQQSRSLQSASDKRLKNIVGSVKSGAVNYLPDMKAFDPDLVPPKAKKVVEEIKEFIALDILCLKKQEWNRSTYVDRTKFYSDQIPLEKKKFEIRQGLRDYNEFDAKKTKSNKMWSGTETRNNYTNWNVSTEFNIRESNKNNQKLTQEAIQKAANKNRKLLQVKGYVKPDEGQTILNEKLRDIKTQEEELRNKIRQEYLYECPGSSEEKTAAGVFKMVEKYKIKQRQAEIAKVEIHDETFKPALGKTLKTRKTKEYFHDGAWVMNEDLEKEAWSCCMNEDETSKGCCVRIRDLDRWQTISM